MQHFLRTITWVTCLHVLMSLFVSENIVCNADFVVCKPSQACYPTQADIQSLETEIQGRVLQQQDSEFTQQSRMYNTNEQRSPQTIVMVQSETDIQKAVLFARRFNLLVAIRSTGHSFVGRSTAKDGFIINLSEMDVMSVNLSDTRHPHGALTTQTGVNWAEIYQLLEPHKRVIVGGSAHTVGPGGFTLGGGHSPISRSLGYAVDHLLEARVVLADGSIATCTEQTTVIDHVNATQQTINDGDLFWALRGGGGGTYGIVVHFVFKLYPMPEQMVLAHMFAPLVMDSLQVDLTRDALQALMDNILTLPSEWGGYWFYNNHPGTIKAADVPGLDHDLPYRGSVSIFMNKFAPWDGTEEAAFVDLVNFGTRNLISVTFSNKSSFWDYEKDVNDPASLDMYLFGTLLQPEHVTTELVDWFQKAFFTRDDEAWLSCTGIMLGGATGSGNLTSTPLNPGYRTAISSLGCGVLLQDPYDSFLIKKADTFSSEMRRFGKGMYFNEPTKNNPNWKEDFWGSSNYERLVTIKDRYDADNLFTCHHCVSYRSEGQVSGADDVTSGSVLKAILALHLFALTLIFI